MAFWDTDTKNVLLLLEPSILSGGDARITAGNLSLTTLPFEKWLSGASVLAPNMGLLPVPSSDAPAAPRHSWH